MSMRDSTSDTLVKRVISSTRVADNTAQVGQIIDRRGFNSLTYAINIGTVADADATVTVLLEHGAAADGSDMAAAPDAEMISQTPGVAPELAASFQFDDDNEVRKLGYIGPKRYTRLTATPAGNSGNLDFGVLALLEEPEDKPVVQGAS